MLKARTEIISLKPEGGSLEALIALLLVVQFVLRVNLIFFWVIAIFPFRVRGR